ncbi:MAG TPA: 1-(5-phosphoribosyl)-5-[(5-phosphoribosylamino)methylideneamino] imidazole-4-carboxamide isomerase [Candidatus Limnocylindrales bacterium]
MASTFDILPAIDLRDGRVVRLEQGDFARETAYSDDPVAVAHRFVDGGARWLHVVDLDGARSGVPAHGDVVRAIIAAVGDGAAVEVAGGLRDEAAVGAMLDAGARRAVVGTAALRDPTFAGRLVDRHGARRIAAAVDVRDGRAIGEGWAEDATGHDAETAMRRLADAGVATFEVTAVARDGLGTGPDLDLYRRLVALDLGAVVASAGIASLEDLAAVRAIGCSGAIVGRALYDGSLDLGDAIRSLG